MSSPVAISYATPLFLAAPSSISTLLSMHSPITVSVAPESNANSISSQSSSGLTAFTWSGSIVLNIFSEDCGTRVVGEPCGGVRPACSRFLCFWRFWFFLVTFTSHSPSCPVACSPGRRYFTFCLFMSTLAVAIHVLTRHELLPQFLRHWLSLGGASRSDDRTHTCSTSGGSDQVSQASSALNPPFPPPLGQSRANLHRRCSTCHEGSCRSRLAVAVLVPLTTVRPSTSLVHPVVAALVPVVVALVPIRMRPCPRRSYSCLPLLLPLGQSRDT